MRYQQYGNNSSVVKFPRRTNADFFDDPIEPFLPSLSSDDYEARPVEWIVPGLIPRGQAVLFTGATKLGKSHVLEDLLLCASLGVPWLGRDVQQTSSLGLFCEDSKDAVFYRRDRILASIGASHYDTEGRAALYGRRGMWNWLMKFDQRAGTGRDTRLLQNVEFYLTETHPAAIVIVDTARQTFDGNENNPRQVTEFVNRMNALAERINGAVIIPHHPNKAGDSPYAGTAAWASTVRVHLDLALPPYFNKESGEGRGERVLRVIGSNYSSADVPDIPLVWDFDAERFVFNPGAASRNQAHILDSAERAELDGRVLQAATAMVADGWLVADPANRLSIVSRLKKTPGFMQTAPQTLQGAVNRLVDAGELVRITIGRGASATVLLRPPAARYANEAAGH